MYVLTDFAAILSKQKPISRVLKIMDGMPVRPALISLFFLAQQAAPGPVGLIAFLRAGEAFT